jgi:prolipoprotein diacylglyceryl transferase
MSTPMQPLAYIPSPSRGVLHLGPLPLRGYALMIILGVVVAVWLGERRWAARGGTPGTVVDIAVWAVPFGLVGGRLYHVITDYQLYFGKDPHIVRVFEVWKGGLGIWGAIAAGALGAYLGCRRRGISLRTFADAAAPGIALAQALGRWGNWFNQELYGRPTKLPWAVKIDPEHRFSTPDIATYHPTFLYESLWCVGVALLVIWAEKRFRLAYGRTFALYVAAYTVGRAWIEWLRVDSAHHILGLRLNDWTSLIVFLAAVAYLVYYRDRTEIPEGAVGTAPEGAASPAAASGEEEPSEPSEPAEAAEVKSDQGDQDEDAGAKDTAADAESAPETVDKSDKPDVADAEAPEPAADETPTPDGDGSTEDAAEDEPAGSPDAAQGPGDELAGSPDAAQEPGDELAGSPDAAQEPGDEPAGSPDAAHESESEDERGSDDAREKAAGRG